VSVSQDNCVYFPSRFLQGSASPDFIELICVVHHTMRLLCCLFTVVSAGVDSDDSVVLLQSRSSSLNRQKMVTELSDELDHLATTIKTRSVSEALSQRAVAKMRNLVEQVQKFPDGLQRSYGGSPSFQEVFEPLSESERETLLAQVLGGTELTGTEVTVSGKEPATTTTTTTTTATTTATATAATTATTQQGASTSTSTSTLQRCEPINSPRRRRGGFRRRRRRCLA